jgi:PhzF family phenazine biosynthesis protein
LVAEGRVGTPVFQTTTAGDVRVEIDVAAGFGWMHQLPPVFGIEVDDRRSLAKAAGLEPEDLHPDLPAQVVSTGVETLLIPIRDEPALRSAERNAGACRELAERAGARTLYFFAMLGEGEILARMLDPGLGIGEDPATGSAAGPLGAYLAERRVGGTTGRLLLRQGELIGRPSFLHVEVTTGRDGWEVRVGGGVRIVGSGSFDLG